MTQIRLKINATFTIDNREKLNDIIDLIGTELSKTFGGITFPNGLDNGTGFWISDGNDFKEKYTGTISKEPIVSFSLSVMPNHKLPALNAIKSIISVAVKRFDTKTEHVHIESHEVYSHHFSVK